MMTDRKIADLDRNTRAVSPEEVAFYEENGWVMLRQLVSRELAANLLEAGRSVLESDGTRPVREQRGLPGTYWPGSGTRSRLATDGVEPFRSLVLSQQMGQVARALINRARLSDVDVPIQYHDDRLWCKDPGGLGTRYHQDGPGRPGDRPGVFNLWLALDEVTPEMGAMRFLSGSQREGPLGAAPSEELDKHGLTGVFPDLASLDESQQRKVMEQDLLAYYPKLQELHELSLPLHYQPGDATVHHGYVVHGAPPNTSHRQRWSYIFEYVPADTQYFFDGSSRRRSGTNQHSLPTTEYPYVYP